MTIRVGQLVQPETSLGVYGSALSRTYNIPSLQAAFNAQTRPLEIRVLAKGLGAELVAHGTAGPGQITEENYATRVFEYVRQNLKPVFIFGQQKGSLGALLDQAGTSFDQSNLLVDLLREGGISATYQLGTISLSATQFSDWTGISSPAGACHLLADGGIPGQVNSSTSATCAGVGSTIDHVRLRHMWVSAVVKMSDGSSQTTLFDPTFKKQVWGTGIDIPAAMKCGTASSPTCGSTAKSKLPTSTTIGGAPAYAGIDTPGLENQFTTFAKNLLTDLQGRSSTLTLQDVVGGPRIDLASITSPAAVLPYATTDVTTLNEIPDQYRIRFRVQFAGIDKQVFADELAGKRLRVLGDVGPDNSDHSATALNISLYAEYEIIASNNSALASPGTNTLTLTVDHPYAASNQTYMDTTTIIDTYSLENDTQSNLSAVIKFRFNPFTILNAWGPTGDGSVSYFADLQAKNLYKLDITDKSNPAHTWWKCQPYQIGGPLDIQVDEGNMYALDCLHLEQPSLGSSWLAQNERMLDLVGRANSSEISTHHIVGYVISGVYWPVSMSVDSALSISSRSNSSADRQAASFSVSSLSSRLEGSTIEQSGSGTLGMSAPSVIDMANKHGNTLISVSSSTWGNVRPLLTGYPSFLLDRIRDTYITPGYVVLMPKEWKLGFYPFTPGSQSGIQFNFGAYFAYKTAGDRSAYIVSYDAKGTAAIGPLDPGADILRSMNATGTSLKSPTFHQVDVQNGSLTISPPPDLVTGTGPFPQSLSFQRVYSSADSGLPKSVNTRATKAAREVHPWTAGSELRYGWSYNLNLRGALSSNYQRAMGIGNAEEAAVAITTVAILRDLQRSSSSFATEVTSTYLANWWGKSLVNNFFSASLGAASDSFMQLADGTWKAGSGGGAKLVPSYTGPTIEWYLFPQKSLHFSWNLTATDGSTVKLVQDSTYDGSTAGDGAYAGAPLSKSYYPKQWVFPTGVTLDFDYNATDATGIPHLAYCLQEVRNNLGRKITFHFVSTVRQAEGYCVIDSVSDENGRSVSFSDDQEAGTKLTWNPPDHTYTVTLPDNSTVNYHYRSTTDEPGVARAVNVIDSWQFPSDSGVPFAQVQYDDLFRVASVSVAPNNPAGSRAVTKYLIGNLSLGEDLRRGESRDPLGGANISYFGQFGEPLQSIDALNQVTSNTFDSRLRLKKSTFPEGDSLEYEYDKRNNTTKVTAHPKPGSQLLDSVQQWTYYEGPAVDSCTDFARCNKVTSATDLRGNVTAYDYNSDGQLRQVTFPAVNGETPRTNYCYGQQAGINFLTGRVDATSTTSAKPDRVLTYTYNAANHLVLDHLAVDPVTSLTNSCAQVTRDGARNQVTTFVFDAIGNPMSIDGARTDVPDVRSFAFDSMRRLKEVDRQLGTDPAYASQKYEYNPDGTLLSKSVKEGSAWRTVSSSYWPSGDLKKRTDPEGNTTNYYYDLLGRTTLTVDPEGRGAGIVYDAAGQRTCEWRGIRDNTSPSSCTWNPASYTGQGPVRYAAYEYSPNGQLKKRIDAQNNYVEHFYDNHDRLRLATFPNAADGTRCTLSFPDAASRDTAVPACAASNQTTPTYEEFSYTVDGSIAGARCGGENQICRIRSRSGTLSTYSYDALDRLSTRSVDGTLPVTFKYNLVDQMTSVSSAAGTINGVAVPAHQVTMDYDDAGNQLYEENLIGGTNYRVSYKSDLAGNRTRVTWPDSYYVTYSYDALNRMEYVRELSDTANELAHYTYDELSRTKELRFAGADTNKMGFEYEPNGNLDKLTNVFNSASNIFDYTNNASGQIKAIGSGDAFYLSEPVGTDLVNYSANSLNQYSSVAAVAPTYDANGNMLTWGPASAQSVYTFDSENQLRSARVGSGPLTRYDYDALGRRISKTVVGGATTYFLPDVDTEIGEYDANGALLRRYIDGAETDQRIAAVEGSSITGGPKSYFHVNHERTVIATTDDAGRLSGCAAGVFCQRMAYDEYGRLVSGQTTGPAYRYTGRRFDAESELYYYRARYYSPSLGRFINADPLGPIDDINLYAYVKNDPVNLVDPAGTNCDNMAREGVTAVKCYDAIPNNGPTAATKDDATLSSQIETDVLMSDRKSGVGVWSIWNADKYEHGAYATKDPNGFIQYTILPGVTCHTSADPQTGLITDVGTFKQDWIQSQPSLAPGLRLAFVHEHGIGFNEPGPRDDIYPRQEHIPNIILGHDAVSVVEISGGEYRVRILAGKFTPDEEGRLMQRLQSWQTGVGLPTYSKSGKGGKQKVGGCQDEDKVGDLN